LQRMSSRNLRALGTAGPAIPCWLARRLNQLQPQPPPQHEPPDPGAGPDEDPPLALLPLVGAANTES
jgi:hypothetical protein